jgi:ribokinase
MAGQPRVAIVGSCIVDFTMAVPRLPLVGETITASSLGMALGGNGANYAVAIARLGGSASLIASVGDDEFGDAFLKLFAEEGVDCSQIRRIKNVLTGIGVPMLLPDGRNGIVAASGAALELSPDDIYSAADVIRSADALLVHLEVQPKAVMAAMKVARSARVPVFLDPVPVGRINHAMVRSADLLMPNETEAGELTGMAVESTDEALLAADRLRNMGAGAVVVTLGAAGAVISADGYRGYLPAVRVDSVDSVGAGDAFASGLVMSRCRGDDWSDAVRFANGCGAASSLVRGAVPSMPSSAVVTGLFEATREMLTVVRD